MAASRGVSSVECAGPSSSEDTPVEKTEVFLDPVEDEPFFRLDKINGVWQLTHTKTLERHQLSGEGPYELAFGKNGMGAVGNVSTEEIIFWTPSSSKTFTSRWTRPLSGFAQSRTSRCCLPTN